MGYNLQVEKRDDYLYFYVTGRDSLEVSKAFWREIIETTIKLRYNRILVDEDMDGSVPIGDVYEVITSNLVIPEVRSFKFAFVDRRLEQSKENIFGETVAKNRGIDARVFTDIEEAKQWIRS